MSNIQAVRRIQFCAGHRVMNHESKCRNMHGHNYVALFHAEADDLDNLGRVIDFSVLKECIGGWIDENWDHGFIFYNIDDEVRYALNMVPNQKVYEMDSNPTAENMGLHLLHVVCPQVLNNTGVKVTKVEIWETENCKVEVTDEDV